MACSDGVVAPALMGYIGSPPPLDPLIHGDCFYDRGDKLYDLTQLRWTLAAT